MSVPTRYCPAPNVVSGPVVVGVGVGVGSGVGVGLAVGVARLDVCVGAVGEEEDFLHPETRRRPRRATAATRFILPPMRSREPATSAMMRTPCQSGAAAVAEPTPAIIRLAVRSSNSATPGSSGGDGQADRGAIAVLAALSKKGGLFDN